MPIVNCGDPTDPNNYWGITLTSLCGTVFDQILNKRVKTGFSAERVKGVYPYENMHINFCKFVLGVHKRAMNLPTVAELHIYNYIHLTTADR